MAFLGYFTQFRLAVLARLSAIFIVLLTGSLPFPVVFSVELEYFELILNQLNGLMMSINENNVKNKGPRSCLL